MSHAGARRGVAAVSMVRNECDIIELFVRINLRAFDHIYIADHGSSDGTAEILARLCCEGLPLTVTPLDGIHQTQAETLTRLMREAAATGRFRYVMPLDADEFFIPAAQWEWSSLDGLLGDDAYGLVRWKTFVPVSGDYFGTPAPLHANFRPRSHEPVQYHKVIVPIALAGNAGIGPGSHDLADAPASAGRLELPLELLHVPVRSSAQLVQKAVLGSRTLSIKRNRLPTEGFHWDAMAAAVRASGYVLDDAALLRHALAYGVEGEFPATQVEVVEDAPGIGMATDVVEYRNLARIEPMAAFDAFMGRACAEINALNGRLEAIESTPRNPLLAWLGAFRRASV